MAENWRFLGLVNYAFILSWREVLALKIIKNDYELFQGFLCKSSLKVLIQNLIRRQQVRQKNPRLFSPGPDHY